jgi:hypothetical protein
LLGDSIGRMGKGGQGWLTWHLSPRDQIGVSYRRAKASPQFFSGGSTQNAFNVSVSKWIGKHVEVDGRLQYEQWKAPVYLSGQQSDTITTVRVTWYPSDWNK